MRALLAMLVGFSTVTTAETVPEAINPEVSIVETGAPVAIENVVASEVEAKGTPIALTMTARSTGEPADSFTMRVEVVSPEGKVRGVYTHARLLDDAEVRFTVLTDLPLNEKGAQLRVTVIRAHVGTRTWTEGVWTDDSEMEIPQGVACAPDFCRVMAEACNVACNRSTQVHGAGCVLSFKCRQGTKYCESSCACRLNVFCGGP